MLHFKFYGNVFGIVPGKSLVIRALGCKKMQIAGDSLTVGEGMGAIDAKIVE
jgi:hypothetical protein